jgi:hypothetical protein
LPHYRLVVELRIEAKQRQLKAILAARLAMAPTRVTTMTAQKRHDVLPKIDLARDSPRVACGRSHGSFSGNRNARRGNDGDGDAQTNHRGTSDRRNSHGRTSDGKPSNGGTEPAGER